MIPLENSLSNEIPQRYFITRNRAEGAIACENRPSDVTCARAHEGEKKVRVRCHGTRIFQTCAERPLEDGF
jgi:hypothetical protein